MPYGVLEPPRGALERSDLKTGRVLLHRNQNRVCWRNQRPAIVSEVARVLKIDGGGPVQLVEALRRSAVDRRVLGVAGERGRLRARAPHDARRDHSQDEHDRFAWQKAGRMNCHLNEVSIN